MKYIIAIVSFFVIFANVDQAAEKHTIEPNTQEKTMIVPQVVTHKDSLDYQHHSSTWTLNGAAYSGYVETYYTDGSVKQRFGVFDGLKQGEAKDWFEDGHQKFLAHYHLGKLHGEKKIWYQHSGHTLASHLNYHMSKLNGLQMKWYPTGEIFKLLNLKMGKEEGLQQAFRKNGVLYANYEAKEGRIFGMKRASLCFELEDEVIVLKN